MGITRMKTGIKGFDKLVEGGFPKGTSVLICGTPGTGKTIFSIQYIYNGAKKYDEKGLYITLEQPAHVIKKQAKKFGWDLDELEKQGKIEVWYIPMDKIDEGIIDEIVTKIRKKKFARLVLDSISTLTINAPIYTPMKDIALVETMNKNVYFSPPIIGDLIVKRFIYSFIDRLQNSDHCTSLLISEAANNSEYLSRDTISEFICDGVVLVSFESMGGEFSRSLLVRKMRHTKNDEDIHPLEINDKEGIIVHDIK